MNQYTPAQLNAIRTWTEERDSLRTEIGALTTDRDGIAQSNREGAEALTDLNNRIAEARGRLAELETSEDRRRNSVANDVAELEARKSRLEGECTAKEDALKVLDSRQEEKVSNIETLSAAHDRMSDQSAIVDQVVGQVIEKSTGHISHMTEKVREMDEAVSGVITKSKENIEQANIVIPKMARFVFDSQRPVPVRRTYPVGHPHHEDSVTPA